MRTGPSRQFHSQDLHVLNCCRCGVRKVLSAEGLERYERESKVVLCLSCEDETPEEAEITRTRVRKERATARAVSNAVFWANRAKTNPKVKAIADHWAKKTDGLG